MLRHGLSFGTEPSNLSEGVCGETDGGFPAGLTTRGAKAPMGIEPREEGREGDAVNQFLPCIDQFFL